MVAACAGIGVAVGVVRLVYTPPPQYAAASRIYVEPTDSSGASDAANASASREPSPPPTDVLLGAPTIRTAIELGKLNTLPSLAHIPDLPLHILTNLEVKPAATQSGAGQVQDLRYTDKDARTAERVLESVIAAYDLAAGQWHSQRLAGLLASLEKQRAWLTERLYQKQGELERLRAANPAAFQVGDPQGLDHRLKALVEARVRAELRRIEAEVRLATLQSVAAPTTAPADMSDLPGVETLLPRAGLHFDVGPSGEPFARRPAPVVNSPVALTAPAQTGAEAPWSAPSEGIDIEAERHRVRQLEETWGPDHPKLQLAKARLAEMERNARQQTSRMLRLAQAQYRLCMDEEERLQRAIDAQKSSITGPGAEGAIQAQILQQVVDRTGKILSLVCERADRLNLEAATGGAKGFRVTTLVPPNANPMVTTHQGPKLLLIPAVLGLLVGFGFAYLSGGKSGEARPEPSARPVRRRVAAREFVLGYVPPMPREGGRGSQRAAGTWVLRESRSKAAKALRRLARRVLRAADRNEARCVLVTSPGPREGRSTVLANLAAVVAQTGREVLLIDASYDHPSQHVLLSDVLSWGSGNAEPAELSEEALERGQVVLRTQLETLSVVSAWPKPANPLELLRSPALRQFMRQCALKYDLLLIDGPSLGEREELDLLAELADAVLYIADAAHMTPEAANELGRRLDLPAVGMIVNTIPPVAAKAAGSSRRRKPAADPGREVADWAGESESASEVRKTSCSDAEEMT